MDESKSASSIASESQMIPYTHFKSLDISILTFFYGLKLKNKPFMDSTIILFYVIEALQMILLPFRRPDIDNLKIFNVIMVIGYDYNFFIIILFKISHYLDPSVYTHSDIVLVVFQMIGICFFLIVVILFFFDFSSAVVLDNSLCYNIFFHSSRKTS
jgi:hypothetical protein